MATEDGDDPYFGVTRLHKPRKYIQIIIKLMNIELHAGADPGEGPNILMVA